MIKRDIIYLIAEDPEAHGIFDTHEETKRKVFCDIYSVTRNEAYRAMANGLNPSFVFILSDVAEYKGEKVCEYNGTRYRIIRSYVDRQKVELTVEEVTVDA